MVSVVQQDAAVLAEHAAIDSDLGVADHAFEPQLRVGRP
jgi:hypothetical protein